MKYVMRLFYMLVFVICSGVFVHVWAQRADDRAGGPTLLIRGGTLIDGTGAAARENGTVVVRGNKIASVVDEATLPVVEGARVVDARGKYVLPGLIDGHAHYAGFAAQIVLHYGTTSVVTFGSDYLRRVAIENGLAPGPRIYFTGRTIDNPPGTFGNADFAQTADEARAVVRRKVAQGVDGIKVYKNLRPEPMRAVIEEAHLHGIPVMGHLAMSARDAALMGIDSLEHATGIQIATMTDREKLAEIEARRYEERYHVDHGTLPESFGYMKPELYADLIKLLVERGTFVTPTLICYWAGVHRFSKEYESEDRAFLADPAYAVVPALDRRQIPRAHEYFAQILAGPTPQQGYKNLQAFLKQFAQAGGKIVAGADDTAYQMRGVGVHRELELLVDAGLTPMQALLGATKYAAEKIWKGHEVGTVEPGRYADFLILDANPLENIRNTRKIHMVIQNGKVLDTRLDPKFVDPLPSPPPAPATGEWSWLMGGPGAPRIGR